MDKEWINKNSEDLRIKPDVYITILRTTLEPGAQDVNELDKIIDSGDLKQIRFIAHRLKGTFSNLRVKTVASQAEAVCVLSKTIGNRAKMREHFIRLKNAFEEFKGQIE